MIEALFWGTLGFLLSGANPFIVGSVLLLASVWVSGSMAGQQLVTRLSKAKASAISLGAYAGFILILAGATPHALEYLEDIEVWQRVVVLVFFSALLLIGLIFFVKGHVKRAND